MRRIVTLAIVLALGVPLSGCGSSSSKDVRASIVAAALAQKSVHWTATSIVAMISAYKTTSDVTTDSGAQTIAYLDNHNKFNTLVHVRLVDHIVYIRSGAEGLLQTVNLTNSEARRYAGQWISIPQGDRLYARMAEGLTLASIVDRVAPMFAHRSWKLKKREVGPNLLVGPTGRYLAVHARGQPLPVEFNQVPPWEIGVEDSVHFSRWNEPVSVHAPSTFVPIATVCGG